MSKLRTLCSALMVTAVEKIRDWRWKARLRGCYDSAKTIQTWTTQRELRELYRLAASCPPGATAVEIGSYLGASTIYLAAGLKQVHGRLVCVDTWNNETMPEGERDTFEEFERNISRLRDRIVPVRKRSEELTQQDIGAEVDFVFIDGEHSYEAVRRDFECILPMLSARALVAFHDSTYGEFPGVSRFIGETLARGQWFLAGNVGGLTCIRRGPLPWPRESDELCPIGLQAQWHCPMSRSDVKVSVIIPCYNHGATLREARASVEQARNANAVKVIIVDDGSSDAETTRILNEVAEAGHCVVPQPNRG